MSNEYGLIMSGKMNSLYEISFFVSKPECLNIENVDNRQCVPKITELYI